MQAKHIRQSLLITTIATATMSHAISYANTVSAFEGTGLTSFTTTTLQKTIKGTSTPQKTTETKNMVSVGQATVKAQLTVSGKTLTVSGQSSFHLQASTAALEKGVIGARALNIALHDVPQELLTWAGQTEQRGSLGFVIKPGQSLRYDAKSQTLAGTLVGFVSADYMGQYAEALSDAERDHNTAPRQAATIKVRLKLETPLAAHGDKPTQQEGALEFQISADESRRISAYPLEIEAYAPYRIETVISWYFEAAKNLCVQPVRIGKFVWNWPMLSVNYTGTGLAFGKPEAINQWRKADITFTWRPWKTIFKSQFFTFSTSEASDLLDEVNDADCVEVYFVNGDNGMHNNWGGGATFWSGESYTKIISSDANATNGIDKVHLAHELGHALDLPHPNSFNASSTNTLMCPSGFLNDNPARNSQENEDNLSNPLLTFSLKTVGPGHDCTNSADCGPCP